MRPGGWPDCGPSSVPPDRPPCSRSADVTISDHDLQGRLRDLRLQADLVPSPAHALAERTRQSYRAQRRRRAALAVTGLVAALVLVGVPVGSSVLLGQRGSGETVDRPAPPLPDGGLY